MSQTGSDKRDVAEIFRERMQLLIEQRGQSLSAFANTIDVDRSALSQFLAPGSTRLPRAETLHAIARTCGVSLDWLIGLIATREAEGDKVPMVETHHTKDHPANDAELINRWHKEATGYKIRYVPATLPDLLRTETTSRLEFANYGAAELASKEAATKNQLTYSRKPETDMEVCMPLQRLESFAKGEGIWNDLPPQIRLEQLQHMANLIEEMYPTFRLFLYDEKELYASPYTVFGPKRAAIYLGNMYMVVNSVEQIKALTVHFDNLIRISKIGPDRAAAHIKGLLKEI